MWPFTIQHMVTSDVASSHVDRNDRCPVNESGISTIWRQCCLNFNHLLFSPSEAVAKHTYTYQTLHPTLWSFYVASSSCTTTFAALLSNLSLKDTVPSHCSCYFFTPTLNWKLTSWQADLAFPIKLHGLCSLVKYTVCNVTSLTLHTLEPKLHPAYLYCLIALFSTVCDVCFIPNPSMCKSWCWFPLLISLVGSYIGPWL